MPRQQKLSNNTATSGSKKGSATKSTQKQGKASNSGSNSRPILPVHCVRAVTDIKWTEGKMDDCFVFVQDLCAYITKINGDEQAFPNDDNDTFFHCMTYENAESVIREITQSPIEINLINSPLLNFYTCNPMVSPNNHYCTPVSQSIRDLFNFLFYELFIFQNIHEKYISAIGKFVRQFIEKFVRFDRGLYCISTFEFNEFVCYGRRYFAPFLKSERQNPKVVEEEGKRGFSTKEAKAHMMSLINPKTLKFYKMTIDEMAETNFKSVPRYPHNDYTFIAFVREYDEFCVLIHHQNACDFVGKCVRRIIPGVTFLDENDFCDNKEEATTTQPDATTETQCCSTATKSDQSVNSDRKKTKKKKNKMAKPSKESSKTDEFTKTDANEKDTTALEVVNKTNLSGEAATTAKNTQGITVGTQAGTSLGEKEEQENLIIANQKKEIERLEKLVAEKNEKMNDAKLESERIEKKCKKEVMDMQRKFDDQQKNYLQAEKNKESKLEMELVDLKKQLEKKERTIEQKEQQVDRNWKDLKKATKDVTDLKKKLEEKDRMIAEMKSIQKQEDIFLRELSEMRRRLNEKDAIIEGNKRQAARKVNELKNYQKQIHMDMSVLMRQLNEKDAIIEENEKREKKNEQLYKKAMDELEQTMRSNMPSTSTVGSSYGGKKPADYFLSYIEEGKNLIVTAKQALNELMINSDVNTEKRRAQIEFDDFQSTISFNMRKAQRNLELLKVDKDAESDQLLVPIPEVPRPFSNLTLRKMAEARERKEQEMNPTCVVCFAELNDGREQWRCTRCTCKCCYECFRDGIEATTSNCFGCRAPVVDDKAFPAPQAARRW